MITEVRAGEGVCALLLGANVFVLMGSYYVLRTVREALILSEMTVEFRSYVAGSQAVIFMLMIPIYGAVAARLDRVRLLSYTTLFFSSHLFVFALLGSAGFRVGTAFFLWVGIFNVAAIASAWAFANDIYSRDQGSRLFAVVGAGGSLGAWAGSRLAAGLFSALGPYNLMLVAGAGLLFCCLPITALADRRACACAHRDAVLEAKHPSAARTASG